MKHKLEADSILLEFGERRILSSVYLKCKTGEIAGILGRNGQGKSCLMKVVYGTQKTESKSVRIDGMPIFEAFKNPSLLTFLPQHSFIPKHLRLGRVCLDFGLDYSNLESLFPEFLGKFDTRIDQVSGGQRRLFEVYLIIKSRSKFSMLDEPFSHLDPVHIARVCALLEEEKKRKGFLLTDHMFRHVIDLSNALYILSGGVLSLVNEIADIERLGYAKL